MNEKGKNIVIIISTLIIATIFGYIIMYLKTPSVREEEINETEEKDFNLEDLNFSNYLYDVDGNLENETSARIMNNNVYLNINGTEYTLNNFGNPLSVRIEHAVKDTEYNVIYVLTPNKLYYMNDVEYESAINSNLLPVFNEVKIDNPEAIAIVSEYDSKTDYRYPTVYLKTKDGKLYISRFGNEFSEYKDKE